jgi:hypothetical protein
MIVSLFPIIAKASSGGVYCQNQHLPSTATSKKTQRHVAAATGNVTGCNAKLPFPEDYGMIGGITRKHICSADTATVPIVTGTTDDPAAARHNNNKHPLQM